MSDAIQIFDETGFILGHVVPAVGAQPARLVSIESEAQGVRLAGIIKAATDLLGELDKHEQDWEPSPGLSAYKAHLRKALAE